MIEFKPVYIEIDVYIIYEIAKLKQILTKNYENLHI